MNPRELITGWIRRHGAGTGWLLGVFKHLLDNQVAPEEAITALDAFVSEVIQKKRGAA